MSSCVVELARLAQTPVKRAVTPKRETEASTASAKKSKPAAPTKKAMKYLELLDMAMKGYKWWEAPPLAKDQRWTYIEHNGVYFAPEYVRHNVPVLYEGKVSDVCALPRRDGAVVYFVSPLQPVVLETSDQEEMATFYAGIAPDGPQLGTPKLAEVFNRNFMRDWKMLLGAGHTIQVQSHSPVLALQRAPWLDWRSSLPPGFHQV